MGLRCFVLDEGSFTVELEHMTRAKGVLHLDRAGLAPSPTLGFSLCSAEGFRSKLQTLKPIRLQASSLAFRS